MGDRLRCWRDLPPFAAKPPPQSLPGSTTPSGSRRRCKARPKTPNRLRRLTRPSLVRSSTCSRRRSNKPRRGSASDIDARAFDNLSETARACLRLSLLKELSSLSTPAIYERFVKARNAGETPADAAKPQQDGGTSRYDQFVADMKAGGFRRLFEDKPVLLRLMASLTRQWIDTSREFVLRLDADLAAIRRDVAAMPAPTAGLPRSKAISPIRTMPAIRSRS